MDVLSYLKLASETDYRVAQNERCVERAHQLLDDDKFDIALKVIAGIRGDGRLRRKAVKDYLIHLSNYLEQLKPGLTLPFGWLRDEPDEFVNTTKNAVALLGEDFTASLIQLCSAPDFHHERYLLHVFLELSFDGYLWTDMVELCLSMAAKDQKSRVPSKYIRMSEKLGNIRQLITHSPTGVMPNPFFDGVAEEEPTILRQRACEILFSPGKPTINLSDIDREIAIATASQSIHSAGYDPAALPVKSDESLALRLFNKAIEIRLYREAVILARTCGIAKTASIFADFAKWVILVRALARDHWDNFFKEIALFLDRMDILESEKIYQKGQETADAYVERVVELLQSALVDLYLELGTPEDLKSIISCYVDSQTEIFPRLDQTIVNPRNFCEILWYLLETDGRHLTVFHYFVDWTKSVGGQDSIATIPQFSQSHSEDRVELPYINTNLYRAVKDYFARGDAQVQRMWTVLEDTLQRANADGKYFQLNDRLVVTYSEPVQSSECSDVRSSDGHSDSDHSMD